MLSLLDKQVFFLYFYLALFSCLCLSPLCFRSATTAFATGSGVTCQFGQLSDRVFWRSTHTYIYFLVFLFLLTKLLPNPPSSLPFLLLAQQTPAIQRGRQTSKRPTNQPSIQFNPTFIHPYRYKYLYIHLYIVKHTLQRTAAEFFVVTFSSLFLSFFYLLPPH